LSSRRRDEPVRLTRIYTRAGDAGETSLGDGSRVPKLDCRIGAFGTVDELNAALGMVLADADLTDRLREPLNRIQNDLCDELNANLPMLKSFILPGGTEAAARVHVARTTCRRAERDALAAHEENAVNPLALAYLNRLSDFLFIAARTANADAGRDEPLWKPGG